MKCYKHFLLLKASGLYTKQKRFYIFEIKTKMKNWIIILLLLANQITFGQNKTKEEIIVLKVNPLIGDTIDLKERDKYRLFENGMHKEEYFSCRIKC